MGEDVLIRCNRISKYYRVKQRKEGSWSAFKALFKSEYDNVVALENVDFCVAPGECIGILGGNGAGKTTLLRILTGVISQSSGVVSVAGYKPTTHKKDFLRDISLVMGQKSQLHWDIPVVESFRLHQAIYGVSDQDYQARIAEFSEILKIESLLLKPTRSLSLGERMRCEVAKALLHRPHLLFFDEPTIGLDPDVQRQLRGYLDHYCEKLKATLILTSHNVRDIEQLCSRVIVLEKGTKVYDGAFRDLIDKHRPAGRLNVTVALSEGPILESCCADRGLQLVNEADGEYVIEVPETDMDTVIGWLAGQVRLLTLSRGEPRTEDVVADLYQNSDK